MHSIKWNKLNTVFFPNEAIAHICTLHMHKSHGSSHPNIDQVWWVYTVIDTAKHKEWKEIVWRLKLSKNVAIAFLLAFCQDLVHVKIYLTKSWNMFQSNAKVNQWNCKDPTKNTHHKSRKTFTLSRKYAVYSGPINLVPFLGENNSFCPPLPYIWLSARAEHPIFWNTDDQLFPWTAFTW